jgi:hypothetical protein
MNYDPQPGKKEPKEAGPLLFFVVAVIVMAIASMLEMLQHLLTLDMGVSVLFFFLLGLLIGLAYRFRGNLP